MKNVLGSQFNEDIKIYVAKNGIVKDSIVDGPGLRYVIFCQGCNHNCKGCHNKELQSLNKKDSVAYYIKDIIKDIESTPLCTGITISGGEPFLQAAGLKFLAKELKQKEYEVAVYTGYTFEHLINFDNVNSYKRKFLKYIDVLIDGKFEEDLKDLTLLFKGSSNQRIIDIPNTFLNHKIVLKDDGRWNRK